MSDTLSTATELNVLKVGGAINKSLYAKALHIINRGQPVNYYYASKKPTSKRPIGFIVTQVCEFTL